jgi:hypothetical protein
VAKRVRRNIVTGPSWQAREATVVAVVAARRDDPIAVVGPHATQAGVVVRALEPGATSFFRIAGTG